MNAFRQLYLAFLLVATAACAAQPEYLWTIVLADTKGQDVHDAELTPSGEILVLYRRDFYQSVLSKYTLKGELCWSLELPMPKFVLDILPVTDPNGDIVLYSDEVGPAPVYYLLKVSSEGELIDEIYLSADQGFSRPRGMTVDSTVSDCFVGAFSDRWRIDKTVFKCVDWDYQTCWSHNYPHIKSRLLWDDVIYISENELVLADQWCYEYAGYAVRCPKGARSILTITKQSKDNGNEWTREYSVVPNTCIKKIIELRDGYLILGSFDSDPVYQSYEFGAFLARINAHGDTLWTGVFPNGALEAGSHGLHDIIEAPVVDVYGLFDVIETADGRIYLLMEQVSWFGSTQGLIIIEISEDGKQLSSSSYSGENFIPIKMLRYTDGEMIIVGNHGLYRDCIGLIMCFRFQ
jgi:hypothetical protein